MVYTAEQYQRKVKRFIRKQPTVLKHLLHEASEKVVSKAKKDHLSGPAMPRGKGSYRRGTLQPRTTRLRTAMHSRVVKRGKSDLVGQIVNNVKYAKYHEYGLGKMPERSFARISVEERHKGTLRMLLDGIMGAYRNAK